MGKFIERLQLFMEKQGINDNQMTVKAGLSVGLLGKAKKSGKDMAAESIEKILYSYPELSAEWLLAGRGEMLKAETDSGTQTPDTFMQLVETIRQQAEEIGQLREQLERMGRIAAAADREPAARVG